MTPIDALQRELDDMQATLDTLRDHLADAEQARKLLRHQLTLRQKTDIRGPGQSSPPDGSSGP